MSSTPVSTSARRASRAVGALIAVAVLSGCVLTPPPEIGPDSAPSPTPSTVEQSPTPESAEPADAPYEFVTESDASVVWSFEPTSVEVIDADLQGEVAPEGFRLVVLHIDGQALVGDPDFFFQFRVAAIDESTGDYWGLSSASQYYAERDLFTYGKQAAFTDAHALYLLPNDWPIESWYFLHHETGEEWIIDVPTE